MTTIHSRAGGLICALGVVALAASAAHGQSPDGFDDAETTTPAAAPAAAPPAPADVPPAAAPPSSDQQYGFKVRELEERVVNLKEKIFRTKTRLLLLKERILNDVIAEAKLVVFHVNDMGGSFKPVQVYYRLDGEDLKLLDNATGLLDTDRGIEIFAGNVAPGNHNLTVEMVYRGDSLLFSYLRDYIFKLRANYTFYATKGKITTVSASGFLKGDITYDLTDRPSIKFKVKQKSYTKEDVEGSEGSE